MQIIIIILPTLLLIELMFKPRIDIQKDICLLWYTSIKHKTLRKFIKIY
jgi:hypothetical protein